MREKSETRILTVAAIRKPTAKGGATEVLFNESPRIFTMPVGTKAAAARVAQLRRAFRQSVPVKAVVDARRGVIKRLAKPSAADLGTFSETRTQLEKPERSHRIDVSKIDPTKFNLVDIGLKVPVFRLCTRVIPSYAKAKEIFDFCAQQSCHLGGPYAVNPCIPFQYVVDGCFARAHKMRWIITTKYKYCCEKVFSFANDGNDRLAVRADKWGGCCVTWWYHVAPLVRVRVRLASCTFTVAMVIDPGMFDAPVFLSTWLAAQETTSCSPNANVSMYSIQPGSAYWPTNGAGTQFGTDPNYVSTDLYLNAYKNGVTCP